MPLNPIRNLHVYFDYSGTDHPTVYHGHDGWSWEYTDYALILRDGDGNRETYPWHAIECVSDRRVLATIGAETFDGGVDPS